MPIRRTAAIALVSLAVLAVAAPAAPAKSQKLGTALAARLMRVALARHFAYDAGYARRTKCNHRISRGRVRCTMSWFVGDVVFFGRGMIWLTYPHHRAYWNYAWRIVELNEYCAVVEHGSDCTRVHVVR